MKCSRAESSWAACPVTSETKKIAAMHQTARTERRATVLRQILLNARIEIPGGKDERAAAKLKPQTAAVGRFLTDARFVGDRKPSVVGAEADRACRRMRTNR